MPGASDGAAARGDMDATELRLRTAEQTLQRPRPPVAGTRGPPAGALISELMRWALKVSLTSRIYRRHRNERQYDCQSMIEPRAGYIHSTFRMHQRATDVSNWRVECILRNPDAADG